MEQWWHDDCENSDYKDCVHGIDIDFRKISILYDDQNNNRIGGNFQDSQDETTVFEGHKRAWTKWLEKCFSQQ